MWTSFESLEFSTIVGLPCIDESYRGIIWTWFEFTIHDVDWRILSPWTHIDLRGPTPIDSLDRLQIITPALEIRSTLAHWNCRGLTWLICQTWNLDSLEMTWPDRRAWNWLALTHTKRVEFQADSKQNPNDQCKVVLLNSSDSKEVHINLCKSNWDQSTSKSKSVWASQN